VEIARRDTRNVDPPKVILKHRHVEQIDAPAAVHVRLRVSDRRRQPN
jgi:hypothetical protein